MTTAFLVFITSVYFLVWIPCLVYFCVLSYYRAKCKHNQDITNEFMSTSNYLKPTFKED